MNGWYQLALSTGSFAVKKNLFFSEEKQKVQENWFLYSYFFIFIIQREPNDIFKIIN